MEKLVIYKGLCRGLLKKDIAAHYPLNFTTKCKHCYFLSWGRKLVHMVQGNRLRRMGKLREEELSEDCSAVMK